MSPHCGQAVPIGRFFAAGLVNLGGGLLL